MKGPVVRILVVVVLLVLLGGAAFFMLREPSEPLVEEPAARVVHTVVGRSVEGRAIDAYTFGNGSTHLLFVGGIHGGYEWNSTLLAYEFIDYFAADSARVPQGLTVTIVPTANPDGLHVVVGKEGRFSPADVTSDTVKVASGRFNARHIDLNRNFDCKWQPNSTWRNAEVSAGSHPFSEPEAAALRDFVLAHKPDAVVFWHSQANAVYASECEAGVLPQTREVMSAYARAAGYAAIDSFDAYPVAGDAEGWLASIGIPAITVELSSYSAVEWEKNLAGTQALMSLYTMYAR